MNNSMKEIVDLSIVEAKADAVRAAAAREVRDARRKRNALSRLLAQSGEAGNGKAPLGLGGGGEQCGQKEKPASTVKNVCTTPADCKKECGACSCLPPDGVPMSTQEYIHMDGLLYGPEIIDAAKWLLYAMFRRDNPARRGKEVRHG